MSTYITLTMSLRVWDAEAFRRAAKERALADGLAPEEAEDYLNPDEKSLGDCASMLIDPGISPPGSEIDGTETDEQDNGDDDE